VTARTDLTHQAADLIVPATGCGDGSRFSRPSLFASSRARGLIAQVVVAVALAALAAAAIGTARVNLARLNITDGFGFLTHPAGFEIGESWISYSASDSFLRAILAALINTLAVALAGILLATLLGTLVGMLRLSANPLPRLLTGLYVELFRNTPLLLQVLVWAALLLKLPTVPHAVSLGDFLFISRRGIELPALHLSVGGLALDLPVRRGLRFEGGSFITPEFTALLLGLTAYYGAFIAEVVRGGIVAVPRGQWEAAATLGLSKFATMRLIILPQAVRIIVPVVTIQYVSIVKATSLGIAIGYPELFWVISTTINITGHAIEGMVVLMGGYLLLTLSTASGMNLLNARLRRRGTA
jgi:general L-amino acid transport system permease protein